MSNFSLGMEMLRANAGAGFHKFTSSRFYPAMGSSEGFESFNT